MSTTRTILSSGKKLIPFVLAFIAGLSWGQEGWWVILFAILPPILWVTSSSRYSGSLILLLYYLTASRGLPGGSAVFFADAASPLLGSCLWLLAAIVSALPWLICWTPSKERRTFLLPLIFLISVVPPIGLVSWTSPLFASAVLYPGFGLFGIALFVLLIAGIGMRKYAVVALTLTLSIVAISIKPVQNYSNAIVGIDTQYGRLLSNAEGEDSFFTLSRLKDIRVHAKAMPPGSIGVFPETVLGSVDSVLRGSIDDISKPLATKGSGMLIGGEMPTNVSGRYFNAVFGIGTLDGLIFKQRVPVPITMWRPWSKEGAQADIFGSGIVDILKDKATILVCYEQLILWPSLISSFHKPTLLIGVANDWWARDTSIPAIQAQSLTAAGVLFGWPVISAVNK